MSFHSLTHSSTNTNRWLLLCQPNWINLGKVPCPRTQWQTRMEQDLNRQPPEWQLLCFSLTQNLTTSHKQSTTFRINYSRCMRHIARMLRSRPEFEQMFQPPNRSPVDDCAPSCCLLPGCRPPAPPAEGVSGPTSLRLSVKSGSHTVSSSSADSRLEQCTGGACRNGRPVCHHGRGFRGICPFITVH